MNTVEGVVDSVDQKVLTSGKTKHSLRVQGVYYGFFDENPGAKVGDRVRFNAKQSADGRYWNGKQCQILGGTVGTEPVRSTANDPALRAVAVEAMAQNHGGGGGDDERQDRIMRQNASSTAGHLVAALITSKHLKLSESDPVFDAIMQTKKASEMIFLLSKHGYGTKFESLNLGKDSGPDEEIGF